MINDLHISCNNNIHRFSFKPELALASSSKLLMITIILSPVLSPAQILIALNVIPVRRRASSTNPSSPRYTLAASRSPENLLILLF